MFHLWRSRVLPWEPAVTPNDEEVVDNKDGGTDGLLASSRPTTAAALRALSPGCIAAWFVAVVAAGSENQWTSPSTKWEDLAPLIFVKLRKRRHRPRSSRSGHHTLLTDSLVPGRTSTAARQKRGARPSSTPRAALTHTLTDRPNDRRQTTPKTKRQKFAAGDKQQVHGTGKRRTPLRSRTTDSHTKHTNKHPRTNCLSQQGSSRRSTPLTAVGITPHTCH